MPDLPGGWFNSVLQEDLDSILQRSHLDLAHIGQRDLILTGGTGFVGSWLTLSFLRARQELGVPGRLILVARSPKGFVASLNDAGFTEGVDAIAKDVRDLIPDELPRGAHIIHAATPTSARLNAADPYGLFDVVVSGQKTLLDVAVQREAQRFLFLSSGAVYGRQPMDITHLDETWQGAPDVLDPANAYHEAKRAAESLCSIARETNGVDFVSARLFAFLAPFLPLHEHFAAGNFVRDALAGGPIALSSGGGSVRSYQYGSDLAVWLWAMLARGRPGVSYNTGSDAGVTLRELAGTIAALTSPEVEVIVKGEDTPSNVSRYVPGIDLAQRDLKVINEVTLPVAVERTLRWHQLLDG